MATLNEFVANVVGIGDPWRVVSAEYDGGDVVNVVLEYDCSKRPPAPTCPDC
ncbi:MAG: hypothetical protein IJ856_02385 [Candidatus Methanomethylophilaceae archaeon]|nr:hypothetical protein [Candidatus Methanomethylophilaceae archaeon]